MSCTSEDQYRSKDGTCCDRCPAGEHLQADCRDAKPTECAKCGRGYFTATRNHLEKCHVCKECSSYNKQSKVSDCTATKDTVCMCQVGFYCSNDDCDHCEPATQCHPGEGVRFKATRTNNTVCAPCEAETFSNVTDFISPCKEHTRCGDFGRVTQTRGTPTSDAVCGNFKSHCSWLLPAGLWSGFVLTVIVILVGFVFWRQRRKSYRTVNSRAAAMKEVIAVPPLTPPLPSSHCQESCKIDECKLSIYSPDDTSISRATQDSSDISLLKTQLETSDSFIDSNHINGRCSSSNLLRLCSEPQEDEWCGT